MCYQTWDLFSFSAARKQGSATRKDVDRVKACGVALMFFRVHRLRVSNITPIFRHSLYVTRGPHVDGGSASGGRLGHAFSALAGASLVTGASIAACAWKLEEKAHEPTRWFQRRRPWGGGFDWAGGVWEELAPLANRFLNVSTGTLTELPSRWERLGVLGPLCLLNSLVYAAWWLAPAALMRRHFLHTPLRGPPWTILLAAFSHQSLLHLGCNMWALLSFGRVLQERWGPCMFGAIFVSACVVSSAAVSVLAAALPAAALAAPGLGASGGIMALVCAACLLEPNSRVGIPFSPGHSVRAGDMVWYIAGMDAAGLLAVMLLGFNSPVGHAAHLGGQAFGAWLIYGSGLGLMHAATDRVRRRLRADF